MALTEPRPVLFVASRATVGGGEVYLLDVLRHLDRTRFTPLVLLPQLGPFGERLAGLGVEAHVLGVDYGWLEPPQAWYPFLAGYAPRVRAVMDLIRRRGVALVHTNSNQVFEGALAARLAGVHHVHVVHIPFQTHLPVWQRVPLDAAGFATWVDALSSAIIAVAEPVAASLSPPVDRRKVHIIHNGVDLDALRYLRSRATGAIRRELGVPAAAPLVTGVGRLHPDKGFDTFVEAAARVAAARPDAHFAVAGGTDDQAHEAELRAAIVRLGLGDRMHLLGFRDDVPQLLAESDVFLLTSHSEGGPYVLLEAVAAGCACVASRCGGFVEHVVRPGLSGVLFDPGDAATAAAHVLSLLSDVSARARACAEAEAIVFSCEFDVRHSVGRLAALYDEVLAQQVPAPGAGLELLLQFTRELGALGTEVTELRERMKRVERAASLVLDNPVMAFGRRVFRR